MQGVACAVAQTPGAVRHQHGYFALAQLLCNDKGIARFMLAHLGESPDRLLRIIFNSADCASCRENGIFALIQGCGVGENFCARLDILHREAPVQGGQLAPDLFAFSSAR